jgi:hypothetical protein
MKSQDVVVLLKLISQQDQELEKGTSVCFYERLE